MSLLAGSAALNLTLIWGTAVALGSHDLSEEPISSQVEQKKTGIIYIYIFSVQPSSSS